MIAMQLSENKTQNNKINNIAAHPKMQQGSMKETRQRTHI